MGNEKAPWVKLTCVSRKRAAGAEPLTRHSGVTPTHLQTGFVPYSALNLCREPTQTVSERCNNLLRGKVFQLYRKRQMCSNKEPPAVNETKQTNRGTE